MVRTERQKAIIRDQYQKAMYDTVQATDRIMLGATADPDYPYRGEAASRPTGMVTGVFGDEVGHRVVQVTLDNGKQKTLCESCIKPTQIFDVDAAVYGRAFPAEEEPKPEPDYRGEIVASNKFQNNVTGRLDRLESNMAEMWNVTSGALNFVAKEISEASTQRSRGVSDMKHRIEELNGKFELGHNM